VVSVPPFGNVAIGDASNGLCGGMVFAVRDFFEAHLPIVTDPTPPAAQSPLFNYIVGRLFDSFNIPSGVLEYYSWMNTPDHDTGVWFAIRRGVAWMTIEQEWPIIKATIDSGHPCPLGLVTVYSTDPTLLGHNHQVMAYAYELDDADNLTIKVYDPNTSPVSADQVLLSLNVANPSHTTPISHNIAIGLPVRGFFHVDYGPHDPGALEPPPLPAPATGVSHDHRHPLLGPRRTPRIADHSRGGREDGSRRQGRRDDRQCGGRCDRCSLHLHIQANPRDATDRSPRSQANPERRPAADSPFLADRASHRRWLSASLYRLRPVGAVRVFNSRRGFQQCGVRTRRNSSRYPHWSAAK
jgi:hypothetical protein